MLLDHQTHPDNLYFWFDRPAAHWYDGLPLANGRIGVMVFGGARAERLYLSETTFWSGEPSLENNPPGSPKIFRLVRAHLLAGELAEANRLAHALEGRKLNYGTNLPFGNLRLLFNHHDLEESGYARELDLDEGIARVRYAVGGTLFTREYFTSAAGQVLVVRLQSSEPGALNFRVRLDGDEQPFSVEALGADTLLLNTHAWETQHSDGQTGVSGHAHLRVQLEDGSVSARAGELWVRDASEVILLMAWATDFTGADPSQVCAEQVAAASVMPYSLLRADHIAEHSAWMGRSALDLGSNPNPDWPLDRRIDAARRGENDPNLCALLYAFGRYLLLGSSRPDSPLPAHLTGAWNDNKACRIGWTADYHLDINTQMNYWIAELTGMGECQRPLFNWLERVLVPSGRCTAADLYDLPGWVAHIVSNAWGFSAWGWSTGWGVFPTGGVWVATHLWDHFCFSGDVDFLAHQAYPILKEAAQFFLAYLVEDPRSGWLLSGPANSPENPFAVDGQVYHVSMAPTVDRVLIAELFDQCIQAGAILGLDDEFAARLQAALDRLPPYQIGAGGQIQEWLGDFAEPVPGHRHNSHLLGLYPFAQITPQETPELAHAARVSFERRVSSPGYEEGAWARNNITLFYARLGDGQAAHASLTTLFREEAGDSLMIGPRLAPAQAYEMDYNTGAAAGIVEMLLQSQLGRIALLPALPQEWPAGAVRGLRARGGFTVSLRWSSGRLEEAVLHSTLGQPCRLRSAADLQVFCDGALLPVTRTAAGEIRFATQAGKDYRVCPAS